MNHLVEVEEEAEVVDVDMDVVVVLVVTLPVTRIHSLPLEPLIVKVLLMKEMLGGLQKDVAMVDHEVPIVVVVNAEVSAMVKLVKKEDLEGHSSAGVALAEGDVIANVDFYFELLFLSILISLVLFAVVNSNVKVLDEVTGEHKMMKFLSKHFSYNPGLL